MKKIKIIALLSALILGFCVYKYLGILNQPHEEPRTNVVVCLVDIPENTTITSDMVELRPILSESVLPNACTDLNSVVGMVMNSNMFAGEQVIANRLVRLGASDATSDSLAYVVEPGMRAITVNVSVSSGVANLLRPGNWVDVIAYYQIPEEEEEAEEEVNPDENQEETEPTEPEEIPMAKMLIQNVQILAVDANLRKGAADLDGYVTVTLHVTPEQALELGFTQQYWSLSLILRSSVDEEILPVEDVILDTILGTIEE